MPIIFRTGTTRAVTRPGINKSGINKSGINKNYIEMRLGNGSKSRISTSDCFGLENLLRVELFGQSGPQRVVVIDDKDLA